MEESRTVFTSEITRAQKPIQNDLYELVKVIPATPVEPSTTETEITCDFQPKNGKQYVPKKRNRLKVKTVRDIRLSFEQDELTYLPAEIEKQQQYLFRKIRNGSCRKTQTKMIAKKIMTCDKPLSRSALHMLMNINPFDQIFDKQYVLYNAKQIRISGSTGGKKRNLYNFDLSKMRIPPKNRCKSRPTKVNGKKSLLRNSLAVKFKPGPLIKKVNLDDSYQKYNFGSSELVTLPKSGFSIQPSLGSVLEPSISNFVQNLRNEDGTISEAWAEFSVSVLCTANNANITTVEASQVTFELNYKCDQKNILMRRDADNVCSDLTVNVDDAIFNDKDSLVAIRIMLNQMLDSVEISLLQDTICLIDDTPGDNCHDDYNRTDVNQSTKEKKKKRFSELDKLDVTVIQLPGEDNDEKREICPKSFCSLGCVCPSLMNHCNIKQHCGRVECMFQCNCDFSKYAITSIENTELLPGIINLDKEINFKLSKEEKKFHQTVIVAGDQSIVLKSQKRHCKPSKRYADFDYDVSFETDVKLRQHVSVVMTKLNCKNIEPWCMVHKLYKCFCKGKITETASIANGNDVHMTIIEDCPAAEAPAINSDDSIYKRKSSWSVDRKSKTICIEDSSDQSEFESDINANNCARIMPYERKHKNSYYLQMNSKITEMEKNDETLKKRLLQLMNIKVLSDENCDGTKVNKEQVTHTPPNEVTVSVTNGSLQNYRYNADKSMQRHKNDTADIQYITQTSSQVIEDYSAGFANEESLATSKSVQFSEDQLTSLTNGNSLNDGAKRLQMQPPIANEILPKDKSRLMEWLVSSYQLFKKRESQGRMVVDPPKNKKLVIYPVSFIQSRYNEKKNLFLTTRNKPYRVFMAVDTKNSFLEECIPISSIRMADLHRYPVSVQNLVMGKTDSNENFYIMCGLRVCWEFIGSICKTSDRTPTYSAISDTTQTAENKNDTPNNEKSKILEDAGSSLMGVDGKCKSEDVNKHCKWFVLIVGSDFHEIQFCERGFFVKHEIITKAITVARLSKKSVRLSSQKTTETNSGPPFGIYAVPCADESCVFIGPYQGEQNLGMEIIESNQRNFKTSKGFWITIKKEDCFKVIDDPLSFLPQKTDCIQYISLKNQSLEPSSQIDSSKIETPRIIVCNPKDIEVTQKYPALTTASKMQQTKLHQKDINQPLEPIPSTSNSNIEMSCTRNLESQEAVSGLNASNMSQKLVKDKPIKAIKIKKSDGGVYYLLRKGQFTKLHASPKQYGQSILNQPVESPGANYPKIVLPKGFNSVLKSSKVRLEPTAENKKPIAEIAPQIKIVDVYSQSSTQPENNRPTNTMTGMFILKPEEINKKLMNVTNNSDSTMQDTSDQNLNLDIENFLATSVVCTSPNADIPMESDEEGTKNKQDIKEVFIVCKTIENLGWIPGKLNPDNNLSFMFPGFVYTEYYPVREALIKINEVMSRKVYVPRTTHLQWEITESLENIKSKHMLSKAQFGPDFVLTRRGLRHKRDIATIAQSYNRSITLKNLTSESPTPATTTMTAAGQNDVEKATEFLNDLDQLEDDSQEMDDRNEQLLQEFTAATTTNPELLRSISGEITNKQRQKMSETLKDLLLSSAIDSE